MIDQADLEWSRKVRERDRHTCRLALPGCQRSASEAHHIVGRIDRSLRHDIRDGIAVCFNCHSWVEANPERAEIIIALAVDRDTMDYLRGKRWNRVKGKNEENTVTP